MYVYVTSAYYYADMVGWASARLTSIPYITAVRMFGAEEEALMFSFGRVGDTTRLGGGTVRPLRVSSRGACDPSWRVGFRTLTLTNMCVRKSTSTKPLKVKSAPICLTIGRSSSGTVVDRLGKVVHLS